MLCTNNGNKIHCIPKSIRQSHIDISTNLRCAIQKYKLRSTLYKKKTISYKKKKDAAAGATRFSILTASNNSKVLL